MNKAERTLPKIYQEKYPKAYAALTRFIEENPDINGWSDEEVYRFAEFFANEQFKCQSCGKPLDRECPRCKRLWES